MKSWHMISACWWGVVNIGLKSGLKAAVDSVAAEHLA